MRVLIIDPYPLFREAITLQVAKVIEPVSVFEAASVEEASALMSVTTAFNLIICSIDDKAYRWVRELIAQANELCLLVIFDIKQSFTELIELQGVNGFLARSADLREVNNALKLVLMGEFYVSPSLLVAHALPRAVLDLKKHEPAKRNHLTPRQLQVLKLVAAGFSNKDIAHELNCSDGTIKLHVSAILKELNVHNRVGAVKYAEKLGLIMNV